MGTRYPLDVCQQCFSLPGTRCTRFQHIPYYLRSTRVLAKVEAVLKDGQFSRVWLGEVIVCTPASAEVAEVWLMAPSC